MTPRTHSQPHPHPHPHPHPRTVITGIGVVAPNGLGGNEYWKSTLTGRGGISPVTEYDTDGFPCRLAGRIRDFDAGVHLPSRLVPQTDRSTQLALTAAAWALAEARVTPDALGDYDMGVVTANALGGFEFTHKEFHNLWNEGPQAVSVYESFAWFYAADTGQISIRHKMRGPSAALVGEQAGGLDALGHARRTIRAGTPLVVAGGVDGALDPWGYLSQLTADTEYAVSPCDDPARAYLPFDAHASGHVPGEGGALLVLEDADSARERGAGPVHAELASHAATFDPPPGSGRPPGLRRAAAQALTGAGLAPGDVDVVFADGAGTPVLDAAEAEAIRGLFGPMGVPVTVPKALTGRLYGGGGPLDVATAVLALRDGVIPPTHAVRDVPDEYGIDLVRGEPRDARIRNALVLARGRKGFNSAVVVRAFSG